MFLISLNIDAQIKAQFYNLFINLLRGYKFKVNFNLCFNRITSPSYHKFLA